MKDRTLENKTRMTIDGHRYRVGNPNHPHYELYNESGFEAVYDMMFKAPVEEIKASDIPDNFRDRPTDKLESVFILAVATVSALILLGMALL